MLGEFCQSMRRTFGDRAVLVASAQLRSAEPSVRGKWLAIIATLNACNDDAC
ncbi:hypothetical protein [Sphingomonas oryzagri]